MTTKPSTTTRAASRLDRSNVNVTPGGMTVTAPPVLGFGMRLWEQATAPPVLNISIKAMTFPDELGKELRIKVGGPIRIVLFDLDPKCFAFTYFIF